MRQLIELLNSFAGTAARMPSSLPSAGAAAGPSSSNSSSRSGPPSLVPAVPPMSAAAAARHPALRAAEAALESQLASNAAGCDREYVGLLVLNEGLQQERSFGAAEARRDLNRYSDVLPYDDNRVLLGRPFQQQQAQAAASGGGGASAAGASASGGRRGNSIDSGMSSGEDSYINASLLQGGGSDGDADVAWTYIAAQGPLRHTRDAFWQMVSEQHCSTIIMLTRTVERGVHKCCQYFAEEPRTGKALGRFSVSTQTVEQLLPDLARRSLVIKDGQQQLQQERRASEGSPQKQRARWQGVQHYHYTAWPDHGVPDSPAPLLRLCAELRATGAHAAPILVHCSAGIGRSGVFCVLDIVSRRLLRLAGSRDEAAGAAAVDLAGLVAELRRQRLGMVQTRDQFVFCHTALLHVVRQLAAEAEAEEGGEQEAGAGAAAPAAAQGAHGP